MVGSLKDDNSSKSWDYTNKAWIVSLSKSLSRKKKMVTNAKAEGDQKEVWTFEDNMQVWST